MSRGPGRVQRAVVDIFTESEEWLTVPEMAARVFGERPSRAQLESVRRALKMLARDGRVELEMLAGVVDVRSARVDRGDGYANRPQHSSSRPYLAAHRPLSVEEKKARDQFLRDSIDRLCGIDSRIGGH